MKAGSDAQIASQDRWARRSTKKAPFRHTRRRDRQGGVVSFGCLLRSGSEQGAVAGGFHRCKLWTYRRAPFRAGSRWAEPGLITGETINDPPLISLNAGDPTMQMNNLDRQRVGDALHGCVVGAVAGAAHGCGRADQRLLLDEGLGGEWADPVRVVNETSAWPSLAAAAGRPSSAPTALPRSACGRASPSRRLSVWRGRAWHQGEPALASGDVGDNGQPDAVRRGRLEALRERIWLHGQGVAAVGGARRRRWLL